MGWSFFDWFMPVGMMVVNVIDPECVYYQEMLTGTTYYIYNNDYPENYTAGTACRWTATSPQYSKIFLSCSDIIMPKTDNCAGDRLEISSSSGNNLSESHNYCGEGSFSLVTKGNSLTITLWTSRKSPGGRFFCKITTFQDTSQANHVAVGFPARPIQMDCDCGWKNQRRIVGGQETQVNEYPAMAALVVRQESLPICGCTIISSSFVLTAGHCVINRLPSDMKVLVGEHDTSSGSDTRYAALYRVINYEIWDGYDDSREPKGDIAIVNTDRINFNENVGPICLPFSYTAETFEDETVTVLGWGSKEDNVVGSDTLQEVDLQVISNQDCAASLSDEVINLTEICTYTYGKDSCQGDSGGPLFWQNYANKRLFLVGIISHGKGCATASPGVNTRVTAYLEWIQSRTRAYYCVM